MRHNAWLGISAAYQSELVDYVLNDVAPVEFPLLANMSDSTKTFLSGIYDAGAMDRAYRKWGGKDYRMWSCYTEEDDTGLGQIKSDFDAMAATYPTDFSVLGAWHYATGEPIGGLATPTYPQPAQTINFMPDVDDQGTRPTELSNILLVFGQPPRVFTPA